MSDIIQLLPDSVANQIAAGEVVQRPASAVKEMMENSLDAGATEIKLVVKEAGKTLIQIIDNGSGMSETDARMCFERHATSKIRSADDLFQIQTMGFRGEALASIAAIAQVELKSCREGDELGTCIQIEGSKLVDQTECVCNKGTTLSVKNLFYNVPARRNFLKSNAAEFRHIMEEFQRIAIIHPEVGFELYHNDKIIFQLKSSNLKQRISNLMGSNYSNKLLHVEEETDVVKISGFVGKPEFARKTRGEQYFFANNRFIKHNYFNHAVTEAYQELIPEGTYPTYFIFMEVDPARIDVNIHPTKTEVNFQDAQIIYAMMRSAVKRTLGQFSLSPTLDFESETHFHFDPNPPKDREIKAPTLTLDPEYNPFKVTSGFDTASKETSRERSNNENWEKLYDFKMETPSFESDQDEEEINQNEYIEPEVEITEEPEQQEAFSQNTGKLFQVHNRFIVSNVKSGIMIVDQQKAHERYLFELMLEKLENQEGASQQLLFPQTLRLSPADAELLSELKNDLHLIGFNIETMNQNTFVVNGVPTEVEESKIESILERILENYKSSQINIGNDRKVNLAIAMAKNMSIKAGKLLHAEEMQELIDQLFTCQVPDISPAGKKIIHILKLNELESFFK